MKGKGISLYIERIALKGFKSFGDHVEIVLSDKYTVIAGPNGSGKSNILDAVRWALGEQSALRLRISKQGDLLFQGSPSRQAAKEAWVSLTLRQDDKLRTFKRILDESGSSFIVDGKRVRLYEMEEEKHALGLDGVDFAFIGQGEVLEAIKQRPMDRRDNLEVLFGIASYRKKREEALLKLTNVAEEARRLKTLIDELKQRQSDIRPIVLKALKKRELQESLDEISLKIKGLEYAKLLHDIEKLLKRKEDLLGGRLRAVTWFSLWERASGLLSGRAKSILVEEAERRQRYARISLDLENLKKKLTSLTLERRNARALKLRSQEELDVLRSSLRSLKSEEERLDSEVLELKKDLISKKAHYDDLESQKREQIALVEELAARKRELLEKKAFHESTILELERKIRLSGKSYAGLIARRIEARDSLSQDSKALKELESRLSLEEKAFEELSSKHTKALARAQKLAAEIQTRKKDESKLVLEVERIKDTLASGAYPRPVEFLLAAKKLGRLDVDFKVMVDALTCPREYTTALQSFLGSRQFWILVNDEEDAHVCIDYIKRANVGRATFLPLNKANPQRRPSVISDDINVIGWIIDLISYDVAWERGVMHLLGNLLLVSGYEDAVKMTRMLRSCPVVTLEGEVFLPSGTISGGRVPSQSRNVLELKGALAEKSERIRAIQIEIDNLSFELSKEEENEISLKREVQLKLELINKLKAQRERTLKFIQSKQTELANIEEEISRLKEEIRKCLFGLNDNKSKLQSVMSKIADMKELDFNDQLQGELRSLESQMKVIEERLKGRLDVLKKVRDDIRSAEDGIVSREKETEKIESMIFDCSAKIREMASTYRDLWREHKQLSQVLEDLQSDKKRLESRLHKASIKLERAKGRLKSIETEIFSLDDKLNELYGRKSKFEEEGLKDVCEPFVDDGEIERLKIRQRRLHQELVQFYDVDSGVLSEDASLASRINYLSEQYEDVKEAKEKLEMMIKDTDKQAGILFQEALKAINVRFNTIFVKLFGGGEAHLFMSDELDLWNSGVEISARPPGKRPQSLTQLSGGERSLTAIAYLFSTMEEASVPLAILDEVDASLDEANLKRFADLVEEYSRNIQIVAITHRRPTMERADIMYGVTLEEPGLSKVISIKLSEWE